MYGMLPVVELVVEYSKLIEAEQRISAEGGSLLSSVTEPLSRTPASVAWTSVQADQAGEQDPCQHHREQAQSSLPPAAGNSLFYHRVLVV